MLSYCLKCKKNKKYKIMVILNCAVCGSKKLRFIKKQETSGLLRNLTGIKDSKWFNHGKYFA